MSNKKTVSEKRENFNYAEFGNFISEDLKIRVELI